MEDYVFYSHNRKHINTYIFMKVICIFAFGSEEPVQLVYFFNRISSIRYKQRYTIHKHTPAYMIVQYSTSSLTFNDNKSKIVQTNVTIT